MEEMITRSKVFTYTRSNFGPLFTRSKVSNNDLV